MFTNMAIGMMFGIAIGVPIGLVLGFVNLGLDILVGGVGRLIVY